MSDIENILKNLPDKGKAALILSGGLDSTISMRLLVEKYGAPNVSAISFDYGQKQRVELERAAESTKLLGVQHMIIKLDALNQIAMGFSANVDSNIEMPTIEDVLGDPSPSTEVPNRNMVMLSLAAAYCQTREIETLVCGIQSVDSYNYWDTTPQFIEAMNSVLIQNRMVKVHISAPFVHLTKKDEIEALLALDGNVDLLKHSLTCYNPNEHGHSCGKCPSCAERLKAFDDLDIADPVEYQ